MMRQLESFEGGGRRCKPHQRARNGSQQRRFQSWSSSNNLVCLSNSSATSSFAPVTGTVQSRQACRQVCTCTHDFLDISGWRFDTILKLVLHANQNFLNVGGVGFVGEFLALLRKMSRQLLHCPLCLRQRFIHIQGRLCRYRGCRCVQGAVQ